MGNETAGKGITFTTPGKTKKTIKLKLVLDEADPRKQKFAGHFDSSKGEIVIFVQRSKTIDSIRRTLFHEGLHFAVHIMQTYGAAALGGEQDIAIKTLESHLSMTNEIVKLRGILKQLNHSLNAARTERGDQIVNDSQIESASKELWEEIAVRAETFYFELLHWMEKRSRRDNPPTPHYLRDVKSYLKNFGVVTDRDLSRLTPKDEELIGRIRKFLLYRQRLLIKRRGVINLYVPHPLEPKIRVIITHPRRPKIGPMGTIPVFDPLKKIEESTKQPVF